MHASTLFVFLLKRPARTFPPFFRTTSDQAAGLRSPSFLFSAALGAVRAEQQHLLHRADAGAAAHLAHPLLHQDRHHGIHVQGNKELGAGTGFQKIVNSNF